MNTEAFILVGGRSSRFGRYKAIADIAGKSIVAKTVETIREALSSPRITLVAASDDQVLTIFGTAEPLPFLFDVYPGRGPFGAVHAALAYTQTAWVFIAACDFPFLSSELLQRLCSFITGEVDAVVPIQKDGEVQPLCAFYRRDPCLAAAEQPLVNNQPTPPVKVILEKVRTRYVSFEKLEDLPGSENFFINMNSADDYERAVKIANSSK
jgi:molybdopterin-guanine dinucleotide biosynthesis protein A